MKGDVRSHIYNNYIVLFSGFMHLKLSEYLISEERKEQFITVVEAAKQLVPSKDHLTVDELNSLRVDEKLQAEWVNSLPTKSIIKVFDWIKLLILGSLKTTAKDRTEVEFWE